MTGIQKVLALAGLISIIKFGAIALKISNTMMASAANGNMDGVT